FRTDRATAEIYTLSLRRSSDLNAGDAAHEFYTNDGLFAVGDNQFRGRDKIRAFYAWRRQHGHMTTRHLINNFQVLAQDAHNARRSEERRVGKECRCRRATEQ